MSAPQYPPTRDFDLRTWSSTFRDQIQAAAGSFGLSNAQAALYSDLHDAWSAAYAAVVDPNRNSKAAIMAKNQARENLVAGPGGARELVAIVQAHPGTTDAIRASLGLKVKAEGAAPVPRPRTPPTLFVLHVMGRTVKCKVGDINSNRRGKPDGVLGATILMHVGNAPPSDPMQWMFALNTSRPRFNVSFPASVPGGAKVWLTAMWFNGRMQTSNLATAQSTCLCEGMVLAKAA